jgi:hypothetical protein
LTPESASAWSTVVTEIQPKIESGAYENRKRQCTARKRHSGMSRNRYPHRRRNFNIGYLPARIRDELNRRFNDGDEKKDLSTGHPTTPCGDKRSSVLAKPPNRRTTAQRHTPKPETRNPKPEISSGYFDLP